MLKIALGWDTIRMSGVKCLFHNFVVYITSDKDGIIVPNANILVLSPY